MVIHPRVIVTRSETRESGFVIDSQVHVVEDDGTLTPVRGNMRRDSYVQIETVVVLPPARPGQQLAVSDSDGNEWVADLLGWLVEVANDFDMPCPIIAPRSSNEDATGVVRDCTWRVVS